MDEEAEVVTYDWDRIRQLIEIVDLLRGHPNLKPLADAALLELNEIANPPKEPEEEETTEIKPETEDEKEPEDE